MSKNNNLWKLFSTFFKIGAFTFGGGFAMIAMIQHEVVEKNHWITEDDMLDMVAISETTPGPIAINTATFVGYKVAGVKGSILATLGIVMPAFTFILIVATIYRNIKDLPIIENAFWGIRIGVLALIVKTFLNMYKQCPKNIVSYLIMLFSFIAVAFFNISAMIVIAVSAVLGLVYYYAKKGSADK